MIEWPRVSILRHQIVSDSDMAGCLLFISRWFIGAFPGRFSGRDPAQELLTVLSSCPRVVVVGEKGVRCRKLAAWTIDFLTYCTLTFPARRDNASGTQKITQIFFMRLGTKNNISWLGFLLITFDAPSFIIGKDISFFFLSKGDWQNSLLISLMYFLFPCIY